MNYLNINDKKLVPVVTVMNILLAGYTIYYQKLRSFYWTAFADSSINFICRFWVDAEDAKNRLDAKSAGIMAIKKKFNEHDINVPFPIRTLQMNNPVNLNAVNFQNSAAF